MQHASAGGTLAAPSGSASSAGSGSKSAVTDTAIAHGLPPLGPQVIKTAQVDLRVAHGQVGRVIIQATRVAGNQRGFVLSTDVARESGYADLVMRVPAAPVRARADGALRNLGRECHRPDRHRP